MSPWDQDARDFREARPRAKVLSRFSTCRPHHRGLPSREEAQR